MQKQHTLGPIWAPWLIVSLFYAYQYILRIMPNMMLSEIMTQFNMDAVLFGQFSGAYYIGYCALHIPVGMALDRFGPKKVVPICILMTVSGILPILFAHHWAFPILGRLLIGVGSSAAILGAFKVIRMTFKEAHFTRMLSLSVTIGLMGALYGGIPVSMLCQWYDYRTVTAFVAFIGALFSACAYYFIPKSEGEVAQAPWVDLKEVLSNTSVLVVCCLAGLMVGPMEGFADAWGSEFLKQVYAFDKQSANFLTSMIYMGMCFAPFLSRIAEKTGSYLGTIAGAGGTMFAIFMLLIYGTGSYALLAFLLFVVGFCCAYQILAIYTASTYVRERVAGLTTAVANMIIMSFGYVFHSSIGGLVKSFGSKGQAVAYTYGISMIPAALFIASLGFFGMYMRVRIASQK